MKNIKQKALGGFLGLAIGDALGAQAEFKTEGSFPRVTEMIGGGVFNLQPGQITDDTIMSILTAKSLIESNGFNPTHMMTLFYEWSSSPECFDIGNTIQEAIYGFKRTGNPYQGNKDLKYSGNGSLMRIYPGVLWTLKMNQEEAFKIIWDMSRLTHQSQIVYDVTLNFFKILRRIFEENEPVTKESVLFDFEIVSPLKSTGFILDTFNVALWGFAHSDSFEEGLLKVVNLGGDADTAGSIYGQLAGSFYTKTSLPEKFLRHIKEKDEIIELVDHLLIYSTPIYVSSPLIIFKLGVYEVLDL